MLTSPLSYMISAYEQLTRRDATGVERLVKVSWFSALQPRLDNAWITSTMKQAGHNDLVIVYDEIDSVWESSDQTASEFTMHFLIKEGVTWYIAGASIKHPKKFITKSRRFHFIPRIAADGIIFDFR